MKKIQEQTGLNPGFFKAAINDNLIETGDIRDLVNRKWDVESPRFKQAAINMGIELWELKKKTLQNFEQENPDGDPGHISVLYNIYLRKLRLLMN